MSWVLSAFETFVNVLRGSLSFWGVLTRSKPLLLVLSGFDTFQKVFEAFSALYVFSCS